ncbi:MAG: ATP-dependent DNA helicase [Promethearchaeota archaeon]
MNYRFSMSLLDPEKLFPYRKFRAFQEQFIVESNKMLAEANNVVISAPNGFGKTVSTLCAAIPVALENGLKIVYCCRTHTQNSRVISELNTIFQKLDELDTKILNQNEFFLGGISLRGRNEMCFKDQIKNTNLTPGDASIVCGQLRADNKCGFFKKLQRVVSRDEIELPRADQVAFDSDTIREYCAKKHYCPYFYTKQLQKLMLVNVANYNWMFNPDIVENFLDSIDVAMEDVLLVIDEAHNLPPLAETLHSLKLGVFSINAAVREINDYYRNSGEIQDIESFLLAVRELLEEYEEKIGNADEIEIDGREIVEKLKFSLDTNINYILEDMDRKGTEIQKEKLSAGKKNPRSYCKSIAKFWIQWIRETLDRPSYYHCFSIDRIGKSNSHYLEAICLDPGLSGIKNVISRVFATISLSGTIIPDAYSALCRIPNPMIRQLPSPFNKSQVKSVILEGVSTGRSQRNPSMYRKYVQKIVEMTKATPKNSAAFCASYGVLKGIKDAGFEEEIRKIGKFPLCEDRTLTSKENDEMINQYKEYSRMSDGAVLLGVCGGRNSEGQDFPGDEMNAVMICGIPYAMKTPRVDKKIDYYDSIFNSNSHSSGWVLAYLIPAMQRANQACGRPIRTLKDRGVIILADDRYKSRRVAKFLSPWILANITSLKDMNGVVYSMVKAFFNS